MQARPTFLQNIPMNVSQTLESLICGLFPKEPYQRVWLKQWQVSVQWEQVVLLGLRVKCSIATSSSHISPLLYTYARLLFLQIVWEPSFLVTFIKSAFFESDWPVLISVSLFFCFVFSKGNQVLDMFHINLRDLSQYLCHHLYNKA